jgi:hypothetical protein
MIKIPESDLRYLRARFGDENVTVEDNQVIVKGEISEKAFDYIEEKTILDFVKIKVDSKGISNYVFTVIDDTFMHALDAIKTKM